MSLGNARQKCKKIRKIGCSKSKKKKCSMIKGVNFSKS